jgi:hypothetical protein
MDGDVNKVVDSCESSKLLPYEGSIVTIVNDLRQWTLNSLALV